MFGLLWGWYLDVQLLGLQHNGYRVARCCCTHFRTAGSRQTQNKAFNGFVVVAFYFVPPTRDQRL